MATITGSVAGGNWNTNGAWLGGVQPGSGDDVLLTATSGNITIPSAVTALCRSIDCTGYTGNLTFSATTSVLTIGNASGGALTFVAGMTLTLTAVGTINFVSTSNNGGTGWNVTTGGKTLPVVNFTGSGGKWVLQDALTLAGGLVLTNGTLDTNGKTVNGTTMSISGAGTRTLTLGASSILLSGSSTSAFDANGVGGLTMTANTATLTLQGGARLSAFNYNGMSIVCSGSGTGGITAGTASGTVTLANFTRTGTAVNTDSCVLGQNLTCTSAFTANGNSTLNRVLVQSTTVGSPVTITAATVASTYADFQDIIGAGAASWNLAAITGGSGNCLGNSGITFTTPVTRYAKAAGNLSSTATWSTTSGGSGGASVPLPQDSVFFDANAGAGTYTWDNSTAPIRMGANWDFTGFTRSFAGPTGTTVCTIYGSLTFASGMTLSGAWGNFNLGGRGSHTITTAGKTLTYSSNRSLTVGINGSVAGGTYTLADALTFTGAGNGVFQVASSVTFNTANFSMNMTFGPTGGAGLVANAGSTINFGTSMVTLNGGGTTGFFSVTGTTTVSAASATFVVNDAQAAGRVFAGASNTYGTLTYTVAGSTGSLSLTGSNTFGTINFSDASNARSLLFTAGTTTTFTNWNVNGTSGKLMTVGSITAANHTLTKAGGGVVSSDYLSISRSQAGPVNTWYAGANSTDGGNNTGWIFTVPPVAIGNTVDARWRVYSLVSDLSDLRWGIRTTASDTSDLRWRLYSLVADASDLRWGLRTTVGDLSDLRWLARQLSGDNSDLQWQIRASSGDNLDARWNVYGLVNDELNTQWGVATLIGDSVDLRWAARFVQGDQLNTMWSLLAGVSDVLQLNWDTRSLVSPSLQIPWSVRVLVSDQIQAQWLIRSLIRDDLQAFWSVRAAAGDTLQIQWETDANVYTIIMVYNGSSWVPSVMYRWEGTEWSNHITLQRWTGTEWVVANPSS